MKIKYIFILLLSIFIQQINAQHFTIEGGTKVVCQGGIFIVLEDMTLDNAGQLNPDYSLFKFNGTPYTPESEIKGSALSTFRDLIIATDVSLQNYVDVEGFLQMGTGILNINDNVLTLPTIGYGIVGETENSRITGSVGGYLDLNRHLGTLSQENPANIGIELTTNSPLGLTNIQRGHDVLNLPNGISSSRWFKISPANNLALDATIRIHYFDNELNFMEESAFTIWKSDDNGTTWLPLIYSNRDMTANWIEVNHQNTLSMYTLAYKPVANLQAARQNNVLSNSVEEKQTNTHNLTPTFTAWPNPMNTEINIQIEVETSMTTTLECRTTTGQLVSSEEMYLEKGTNTLHKNVTDFPAGVYLFTCRGTEFTPLKIVKPY